MSKKMQNQIYLSLTEDTIIDSDRLKSDDNYLGAVTEKIGNVSETGMEGCDLQDWLVEGDWAASGTIAGVAAQWDEVNEE